MSRLITEISNLTGLSEAAVRALYDAMLRGGGSQAQFDHPDLGGMGQWMRGGMVMIGDMFNKQLAARVQQACELLSDDASAASVSAKQQSRWWPAECGEPAMCAGQDDLEYAYFPPTRRLAVRRGGNVALYDVGTEEIRGVGAQSGNVVVYTASGERSLAQFKQIGD